MTTLELTVVGPELSATTRVRAHVPLRDELPLLVMLVGDGSPSGHEWFAAADDGTRLHPDLRLADQAVTDGSRIRVARRVPSLDPTRPAPDPDEPHRPTVTLPPMTSTGERLRSTLAAFLGLVATPESLGSGPVERARSMWAWGDHERRVAWSIGRPGLARTVVVGVCSLVEADRGAALALRIARRLAFHRHDRVAVICSGNGRLPEGMDQVDTTLAGVLEHGGLASPDARFGWPRRPLVVGAGAQLPPGDGRRALRLVAESAEIVIIDCGEEGMPSLRVVCDQLVTEVRSLADVPEAEDQSPPDTVVIRRDRSHSGQPSEEPAWKGTVIDAPLDRDVTLDVSALLSQGWPRRAQGLIDRTT